MKTKIQKLSALFLLGLFALNTNAITIDSDGHTILDFEENIPGQINTYGEINFNGPIFDNGPVAAVNNLFNSQGSLFSLSSANSTAFDLFDAELAGFGGPVDVFATFTDGTIETSTVALSLTLTKVDFNLFGLQSVEFSSLAPTQLFVDNIDVPEPSTLALLGLGVLGLSLSQLKRKR